MRRLLAILLLLSLTFQSVWGAAEAYCEHEQGRAALHVGHHVHELAGNDGDHDAQVSDLGHPSDQSQSKRTIDHDHHCCSVWVMLPQTPLAMVSAPKRSDHVAELAPFYRSADPSPIERPNWPASL